MVKTVLHSVGDLYVKSLIFCFPVLCVDCKIEGVFHQNFCKMEVTSVFKYKKRFESLFRHILCP